MPGVGVCNPQQSGAVFGIPGGNPNAWVDPEAAPDLTEFQSQVVTAWTQPCAICGLVWREAFTGDVVCVTPARRAAVAAENAALTRVLNRGQRAC